MDSQIINDRRVDNRRIATRHNYDCKCLLQLDDIKYPCVTKNISASGALIDASFIIPVNIQLGDTCNLLFSSYRSMPPRYFKSIVTRLEDSKIALHFLDKSFSNIGRHSQ